MRISYKWLRRYIDTDLGAEKIAELLTFGGLEVESVELVETVKGGFKNYVVGNVETCQMHPNSDHLHITTVDVGEQEPLHIVCGAPNVAKGQKVIVAKTGARVYTSDEEYFEIKKSKLRGEVSEGMICSEKELGLSDNHDGIMVLDDKAVPGTPAKEYFQIEEDYILEIGLTANRSDAASHIGVARDLLAILNLQNNRKDKLKIPSVEEFSVERIENVLDIRIDTGLCKRYTALTISGIKVGDSPKWLADSLRTIGIRPINNIVDATNYVLMETGQPLHAFDLSKVKGNKVEVKTLAKGTKFTTLDGTERELNGREAMVCNAEEPMCMGGIYGGMLSGVNADTESVLIESAYFDPVVIRKASKYHGLKTDASFRYERGADVNITPYALKRVALLIKEIAGGYVSSELIDVYPVKINPVRIELDYKRMDGLIGKSIERQIVKNILNSLDIDVERENENGLTAIVPTNKVDVTRECDLVEEILRIYGYNNVETGNSIRSCLSSKDGLDTDKIQNSVSDYLSSSGFNETMNNSLTKLAYYKDNEDFPMENSVCILNALSKDLGQMRQTLLYGQLETISYNINRKTSDLRIFEFGNCYVRNADCPDDAAVGKRYCEQKHLAILTTGKTVESWQRERTNTDFYYLKNIFTNILELLRIDQSRFSLEQMTNGYYQYALAYVNKENKKTVATLGLLKRSVCKGFDIKQDVYYADVNWDLLLRLVPSKNAKYEDISKFPEVRRDLALVVSEDVTFAQIESLAYQCERKLLRSVSLFDVYKGDKLPKNCKQYAIAFVLQDKSKTLTDKQIESIMNKMLHAFEQQLGAKLR